MFREMRRKKNVMDKQDAMNLLKRSSHGVLGMISDNGYPYTVFVNHVVVDGKIYIHCAKEGHKIDCIKQSPSVSFATAENVKLIPEEFTTKYTSIICFGKARLIPGNPSILREFITKFSSDFQAKGFEYAESDYLDTQLIEIEIDHITGKNTNL